MKTFPNETKIMRIAFTRICKKFYDELFFIQEFFNGWVSIEAAENDNSNLANIWFGKLKEK